MFANAASLPNWLYLIRLILNSQGMVVCTRYLFISKFWIMVSSSVQNLTNIQNQYFVQDSESAQDGQPDLFLVFRITVVCSGGGSVVPVK